MGFRSRERLRVQHFAYAMTMCLALACSSRAPTIKVLESAQPSYAWSVRDAVLLDMDGDGSLDLVTLGTSDQGAAVGVVLGGLQGSAQILAFSISPNRQLATCGPPSGFSHGPKSPPDPTASVGLPPGYNRCSSCPELIVSGTGECDPLHVFWDHETNALGWWRR